MGRHFFTRYGFCCRNAADVYRLDKRRWGDEPVIEKSGVKHKGALRTIFLRFEWFLWFKSSFFENTSGSFNFWFSFSHFCSPQVMWKPKWYHTHLLRLILKYSSVNTSAYISDDILISIQGPKMTITKLIRTKKLKRPTFEKAPGII